jgi:hypothetical protein
MFFSRLPFARECGPSRRSCRPSYRLQLESLEDRRLLSKTTVWTGKSPLVDFVWSDSANWDNGPPGAGDTAVFNSDSVLTQFSKVDMPFTIGGLVMQPATPDGYVGQIEVQASLHLTGSSECDLGNIYLDRNTSLTNDGTMTINQPLPGANALLGGAGTFRNDGTMVWVGGSTQLSGYSNIPTDPQFTLDNAFTGVIRLASDASILASGFGGPTFTNEGTIEKTAGIGTSTINMPFTNTGVIDAESGTISLAAAGTIDTGGTFQTGASAAIELANGSNFTENGTFTATGSGTLSVPQFAGLSAGPSGATFNVANTVTFAWRGQSSVTVPAATTLTFNGPITVDTTTGEPTLTGGGTFLEKGNMSLTGGNTLNLGWDNNTPGITTLDISSGSTLNLADGTAIYGATGDATHGTLVTNAGLIEKTAGTGTATLTPGMLNNSGTIGVYSGTLAVDANNASFTFTNAGNLVIAAGCTVQVLHDYMQTSTGVLYPVLASATSFGQLQVEHAVTLGGALAITPAITFAPTAGESFPILGANTAGDSYTVSGTFGAVFGQRFANGIVLNPVYSATQVVLQGAAQQATISGTVFQDINTNGIQDPGEPGLAGQFVTFLLNGSHVGAAVFTDASGQFHYTAPQPGTYTVRLEQLGGVLLSAPTGGIYQVTVAAGQNVTGINFADVPTSITVPLTLPPSTPFPKQGNANADYIEVLYRAILDRNADTAGLASWTSQLNSGAVTRLQVVQRMRQSPEHFSQEATDFYSTFLSRTPDPAGLAGWVQRLESGLPEEQMAFNFLDSPEYLSRGDKYFVDQMYQSLLGRTFDPAGEASWLSQLGDDSSGNPVQPPTLTHEQVINDFMRSQESLTRLVEGYYQVFLQRLADPQGLNSWWTALDQGGSFLTIGQQFLSSQEFYDRAAGKG